MWRALLHLLLILSLATNALAAPRVAGSMAASPAHAHGATHEGHGTDATMAAPPSMHGMHEMHGMHPHHASHATPATADESPGTADDCCRDANCSCGCVLPPMLLWSMPTSRPASWCSVPLTSVPRLALVARVSPPFRPPSA